jgi:hypothetical protein
MLNVRLDELPSDILCDLNSLRYRAPLCHQS